MTEFDIEELWRRFYAARERSRHKEREWIKQALLVAYQRRPSQTRPRTTTREARMEEIERQRDTILAECNPDLPTYEAKG